MNPYDLGEKNSNTFFVDDTQKIKMSDLVGKCHNVWKRLALESEIRANGLNIGLAISKTGFGGERLWFACPKCNKRAEVLFTHPITGEVGCRKCLGLKYRKNRYKGMIEEKT